MSVYAHTPKTHRKMGLMVNGCVWMLYIPGEKKKIQTKRHKGGRKGAREVGSLITASAGTGSQRCPSKADPPERKPVKAEGTLGFKEEINRRIITEQKDGMSSILEDVYFT